MMHALRVGDWIPRSSEIAIPSVSMVMTFVSSVGHDRAVSPFMDQGLSQGVLRDVEAEIVQPRDFALPDAESPSPAAPNITPKSGDVRILCEVHIHQGRTGDVQAVDFGECTRDSVWQRSLLRSIQRAAKLVAPTEEGEFPPVRTLLLDNPSPSPEGLARQLSEPVARR
jgi:hypothetical protein